MVDFQILESPVGFYGDRLLNKGDFKSSQNRLANKKKL